MSDPSNPSPASDPVLHDKPIALRLTESERQRTMRYARGEGRSASNFARFIYLRGLADFEREQELQQQRAPVARTVWS
jgi:hypothetical protein